MNFGSPAPVKAPIRQIRIARGFTLIEALVVIAMMAILAALAAPSFRGLIERYRVERMATAFIASVTYARSEAVRRARTVTVRVAGTCTGTDWSCGWETVTEKDKTVEVIRTQDPDERVGITKTVAGGLSFDAVGISSNPAGIVFHPAGEASSSNATVVCISTAGRVKRIDGASQCT